MDCRSVSAAERVCDCDEGVQCPNERKPIFFIRAIYCYPGWFATADVLPHSGTGTRSKLFSANALPVCWAKLVDTHYPWKRQLNGVRNPALARALPDLTIRAAVR